VIVLLRIDDRLIHGQVVLGWGTELRPDRILLVDDGVAANDWERGLYAQGWPEVKISIFSLAEAAKQLAAGVFEEERVILIVRSPQSVIELMDLGLSVTEVNVGGLHFRPGREKLIEGVYINAEERVALRELVKRGVTLDGRATPGSPAGTLNSLVV
jgi:mannose/fructose/N-acetylgalactosamine-specific phosphotransferase system component IIB